MNQIQKDKLFEIFEDEILNDEYTRTKGPFIFRVFSSKYSNKIVIKCIEKENFANVLFKKVETKEVGKKRVDNHTTKEKPKS